jgi:tetratricopeptide (TPR) repeat protein
LNAEEPWSSPFAVLLSYGIPGVLILVGLLLLSEGPKGLDMDRAPLPGRSHATLFLAGGILAVLVANLIDFALFEPAIATCFWAMVGCLIASSRDRGTSPRPLPCPPSPPDRLGRTMILCTMAGFIACGIWTIGPVLESSRRIEQAGQATAAGDFDLAHRLMEQATAADRLSATAPGLHGKVYLQQVLRYGPKDPSLLDKAVACLVTATRRNPADFRDYERLGDAYDLLGQSEQAYQAMHEAALRYPGCERLWFRLGQIAERRDKPQLAAEHYAKAIEIEDAFRHQFAALYPDWKKPVSRLSEESYQSAKNRLRVLGKEEGRKEEGRKVRR